MKSKLTFKESIFAGLYAGGAAAAINGLLFLIFHASGILSDSVYAQPNRPLPIAPVIIASIVPLVIGSLIFFLFEKFTDSGLKIFNILAVVLLVLSLYSPFGTIPNVPVGYALVLCFMHIVSALALLYFLNRPKFLKFS